MDKMDRLRAGIVTSLPEVNEIRDEELRRKVVEAWAFALAQADLQSIDDMPAQAAPEYPPFKEGQGTQSGHFRGVALIAQGIADALEKIHPNLKIDRDLLWACALCHDLGKPFEMCPRNQARWKGDVAAHGYPAIRHPAYGVYVALTVGLPEAVAHAAGAHSGEGQLLKRSLLNTIVHYADDAYWYSVDRAGLTVAPMFK
jgi:23S rRNA maturation-related 3'-5' exoribonuclease YhaM